MKQHLWLGNIFYASGREKYRASNGREPGLPPACAAAAPESRDMLHPLARPQSPESCPSHRRHRRTSEESTSQSRLQLRLQFTVRHRYRVPRGICPAGWGPALGGRSLAEQQGLSLMAGGAVRRVFPLNPLR